MHMQHINISANDCIEGIRNSPWSKITFLPILQWDRRIDTRELGYILIIALPSLSSTISRDSSHLSVS